MDFGHRVWKFYSAEFCRRKKMSGLNIGIALEVFLELIKLLKKEKAEEFKKEWVKDEALFIAAWKVGDTTALDRLFDKYYRMLDILS